MLEAKSVLISKERDKIAHLMDLQAGGSGDVKRARRAPSVPGAAALTRALAAASSRTLRSQSKAADEGEDGGERLTAAERRRRANSAARARCAARAHAPRCPPPPQWGCRSP